MSKGKGIGIAIIGVGIFVGLKLSNTVSKLKDLIFKPLFIKAGRRKLMNQELLLSFEVNNPNKQDIAFNSFVADVFILNKKFTTINFVKPIKLIAETKNVVPDVPFILNLNDVLKIVDLLLSNGFVNELPLNIKGTLSADGFNLPVNTTFNIKAKL